MSETAPSAPGSTTPGWKTSKPIPAIPAKKSRKSRFGSISTLRMREKSDRWTFSICAPAVWSTKPFGFVFVPSSLARRAGRVGAIVSITWMRRASVAVTFAARRTAASAQAPFRPWLAANPRSLAA